MMPALRRRARAPPVRDKSGAAVKPRRVKSTLVRRPNTLAASGCRGPGSGRPLMAYPPASFRRPRNSR